MLDMLTTPPIANEITIFSCILAPAALPGEPHVHCGRHTAFEEVECVDGSIEEMIVLPRRRAGNWRARLPPASGGMHGSPGSGTRATMSTGGRGNGGGRANASSGRSDGIAKRSGSRSGSKDAGGGTRRMRS